MGWQEVAFHGAAFIAGLFLLEFGAERFIEHTAIVARRLGISPALIALLTAGAEWEELVVVVAASLQQRPTLALGNVVGSSISNILGAFSLGLIFHHPGTIIFDRSSKIYTTLQLLISTVVVILAHFQALTKTVGGILVVIFAIYVGSIGFGIYKGMVAPPELSDSDSDTEEDNSDDDAEDGNYNVTSSLLGSGVPQRKPQRSILYHTAQLFLGFLALSISGYILSHSAVVLANFFNLSGTIMGMTILSFATTLPEKFIAVMGGTRGERAIVVANTAGSNIFLLSLCLGVTLLSFGGDSLNASISQFEIITLWISSALFFAFVVFGSNRWLGLILVFMYIVFITLEFTVFKH